METLREIHWCLHRQTWKKIQREWKDAQRLDGIKYQIGCDRSGFDFVDYEEGSQAMMFT